ncbi:MAG: TonB-dependent receptor [Bacteroidota bacterium]
MKRMIYRGFLVALFLGLCPIGSFGQTLSQTVKGKVIDSETGAPLVGATVQLISDFSIGSITDGQGYFTLNEVPVGRQSLVCQFLGYEDYIVSEVLVGSAKEVELTIPLSASFSALDEVVVTQKKDLTKANNVLATVSSRSFSVEETKRFPASISDPSRMALNFAGVSNGDDSTNEIIIRGNAPNLLLWKIEGIEVPQPNHFSQEGFNGGAVSILSTNMLGKSDFFTGAFPAEYGNALSGVFDINLRNGNNSKREYAFQFGVLGTDIAAEGPFGKNYKGSYLVNYRYSTLSLLNNWVEVSENSVPVYQDLSLKLNFPLSNTTTLSLWGIGGISEDNNDNEEQEDPNFTNTEEFTSNTYLTGLTLKHFFKDNSSLTGIISYSGNGSKDDNSFTEVNGPFEASNLTDIKNSSLRLSFNHTRKIGTRSTLKLGTIYSRLDYSIVDRFMDNGATSSLEENGNGTMFQWFGQLKYRFSESFWATFGLHNTHFSINQDYAFEPRAGAQWKIAPKHTLNFGLGLHSRTQPLYQYFVAVPDGLGNTTQPNQDLKLMRAAHYIAGHDWKLIKNGHLKIEAYYQQLFNVGVAANPLFTDATVNGELLEIALTDSGRGRNYGLELTFEKFFSKQYYYLLAVSLYDSKYRAANGQWYNSRFNQNYTFNVVGGREFTVGKGNNSVIGTNLRALYSGGQRATPFNITASTNAGEELVIQNLRNTERLGNYFRLDASFYYRLNRPKVAHIFSLDIQNATNAENVREQFLNFSTGLVETENQLSLIPVINYRIEF